MRLIVFSTSEINLPSSNAYEAEATWNSSDYLVPSDQRFICDYTDGKKVVFDLAGMPDIYVYDFDDEFLQLAEYHKWSEDAFVDDFLKAGWAWHTENSKELGKYGKAHLDYPSA